MPDNCDGCAIGILSFGPHKEPGFMSAPEKSDIIIHPKYWEGYTKNHTNPSWQDRTYLLYNLVLIKTKYRDSFNFPVVVDIEKRQLNR